MQSKISKVKELHEVADLLYLAMVEADPESIMPELTSMIGNDAALKIVELFGGMTVKIPTKENLASAVKNACIWRDHTAGVPLNEMMDKHKVSAAKIIKVTNRWAELHKAAKAAGYAD